MTTESPVDQLRAQLRDEVFYTVRLRRSAEEVRPRPRLRDASETKDRLKQFHADLAAFWQAHDQSITLIGKLPDGCLDALKQTNPVWPGMIRDTVAKLGDVLQWTRPHSDNTLPQFLNCADVLRSDETTARLRTLQDADAELRRAGHDNGKKDIKSLPESPDVLELCRHLKSKLDKFGTMIECARDFCRKNQRGEEKAELLLRQAKRFRHLWPT